MLSKKEIRYIKELQRNKCNRQQYLKFVVEGSKLIESIIPTGKIDTLYYLSNTNISLANIKHLVNTKLININELQSISLLQTPQDMLAIVNFFDLPPSPIIDNHICLIVDHVQDPGNFGTILRIADWFDIQQIIASHHTVDIYNPKVIQASMGSIAHVSVWYKDLHSWFKNEYNKNVYGSFLQGKDITQMSKIKEGAIIVGNEGQGIDPLLQPYITHAITIPRKGLAESLNVSIATGIILSYLT